MSARTWMLAAIAVLLVVGIAAVTTARRSPANTGAVQAADPYAPSLQFSDITLTEATSGAGGKSIYVDGKIANSGPRVLSAALLQVSFQPADGSSPHRETAPLTLVRTRVPYVDLQPVSSAPLAPGAQADFRLIFESVPATWDEKPPAIRVVHAETR